MSTFKSAYECQNLEEFVNGVYRVKFDQGKIGISVNELKTLADQRGVKYKSNVLRDELFDLLLTDGLTPLDFYKEFPNDFGVIYHDYIQRFNVTKSEFDKLKRRDFLKVVNYTSVKLYGRYVGVPVFSAGQFFDMTREKIDEALATKVPRKKKPNI